MENPACNPFGIVLEFNCKILERSCVAENGGEDDL